MRKLYQARYVVRIRRPKQSITRSTPPEVCCVRIAGEPARISEIDHNAAKNKLVERAGAWLAIRKLLRKYTSNEIERAGHDSAAFLSRQVLGTDEKR